MIEHAELNAYAEKRKKLESSLPEKTKSGTANKTPGTKPVPLNAVLQISADNQEALGIVLYRQGVNVSPML